MDKPLPAGWRWVRLLEVSSIIMGQSPPGSTYRKTSGEGLPFFQGKADFGERYPTVTTWCVEPTRIAEPGDILISVRAPVGPTNVANCRCCIGRGLAAIRPSKIMELDFLLFSLKHFEEKITQKGKGSTFDAIRKDDLINFRIPLPPLDEQRRIVAMLNEKMAAVQQSRQAAEEQLRAVQALPAAYLRQAFPQLGQPLPMGWRWVRLGEVCDSTNIKDPRKEPNTPFIYVDISSINKSTKYIDNPQNILGINAPSRARQLIKTNDVIVSTTRPNLNAVALISPEYNDQICSTGFCVLRPQLDFISPIFLYYFVQDEFFVSTLSDLVKGALYPAVTDNDVRDVFIPLPPLDEQRRIVALLNEKMAAVQQARQSAEEQLCAVQVLPAAYLRQAFAGEL